MYSGPYHCHNNHHVFNIHRRSTIHTKFNWLHTCHLYFNISISLSRRIHVETCARGVCNFIYSRFIRRHLVILLLNLILSKKLITFFIPELKMELEPVVFVLSVMMILLKKIKTKIQQPMVNLKMLKWSMSYYWKILFDYPNDVILVRHSSVQWNLLMYLDRQMKQQIHLCNNTVVCRVVFHLFFEIVSVQRKPRRKE